MSQETSAVRSILHDARIPDDGVLVVHSAFRNLGQRGHRAETFVDALAEALGPRATLLMPAMSWRTAVSMVKRVPAGEGISYGLRYRLEREATIATVPVGYADGYSRLLGGKAEVLIRGSRYPVVGNVTMDQLMVDCGDEPVETGDEAVLMGRQGGEEITAEDLAGWMGTANYEIVCMVSERVPREYVDEVASG